MHLAEVIRRRLGWCPNATAGKIRTFPDPGPAGEAGTRSRPVPAAPPVHPVAGTAPAESRPEYQENFLLIILLVGGLVSAWDIRTLAFAGIVSAIVVYYDAVALHAGQKFGKESLFGDVVQWRPFTWALCVLIGSLIFLAIYTFSRKEIYTANL